MPSASVISINPPYSLPTFDQSERDCLRMLIEEKTHKEISSHIGIPLDDRAFCTQINALKKLRISQNAQKLGNERLDIHQA
jgi:hypothetical protein